MLDEERLITATMVRHRHSGAGKVGLGRPRSVRKAKRRLLMISDDPGLVAVLSVTLERAFVVAATPTISGAYGYLGAGPPPDAVILDAPSLDSDVVNFVGSLRLMLPRCPAIILYEDGFADAVPELTALVIHGFFRKPVRVNLLLSRLQALLISPQALKLTITPYED